MEEYKINGDIPRFLKLVMVFIDRVGFPVLAFVLMFWMSFCSINRVTSAIEMNTRALTEFSTRSAELDKTIISNQMLILDDVKRVLYLSSLGGK